MSDDENTSDKGDYKNFMSKEDEQPNTVRNCINEYIDNIKKDNIYNFPIKPKEIKKIILIVAVQHFTHA